MCIGEYMTNIRGVVGLVIEAFKSVVIERQGFDQTVTSINVEKGSTSIASKIDWQRTPEHKGNRRKFVLIMESPHKDEFDKHNQFLGPAVGDTGENISSHLAQLIQNILALNIEVAGDYDLILMNAVTFQCSLGFSTDYFRDLIFIGLWFDGGKEHFQNRIRGLNLTPNDIVLNCCTQGSHKHFKQTFNKGPFNKVALKELFSNDSIDYLCKDGLSKLVFDALISCNISANVLRAPHPVMWSMNPEAIRVEIYT